MNQVELIVNTYREELYNIPVPPVIALPTNWNSISEGEKILLEKILGVAKISLNHVKILTTNKLDVLQWKEQPSYVVAFGIEVPGLAQNEVIESQAVKMIVTVNLTTLGYAEKELKLKLANALKQMFKV